MFRVRLKSLRETSGFKSQQSFANSFGVAQSTVAGWEAGKREPNFDTVTKLADFFDVSIDYLLGHEKKSAVQNNGLSPEDEMLVFAYHNASEEDRQIIDNIVKRYVPSQERMQIG